MTWQNDGMTVGTGMTRRRGLTRLLAGAAGASALWTAACGTAAQSTPAPAATMGPTTLDVFISTQSGPEAARNAAIDALKQKYPQIALQTTIMGGSSEAEEKVTVAAAASTMPDVFWSHMANTGTFAYKKLGRELDSLVGKSKDLDINDFLPQALEHWRWQGKLYGLPQQWEPNAYYYNKGLIQKAGLEDPAELEKKGQWTLAKFEEYLKTLTLPNADPQQWGTLQVPVDLKIQVAYLWGHGGDAYSKDFKEVVFNSPPATQGWEALMKQRLNGWTYFDKNNDMVNLGYGKVAFTYFPRQQVKNLVQFGDTPGFGVVPVPTMPVGKPVTRASTAGYMVATVTKKLEAAWAVCTHFGTVFNDTAVAAQATSPNRKSALKSETYLKSLLKWEDAATYAKISDQVRTHVIPPGGVQIIDLVKAMYESVATGQMGLKPALDDAKRRCDEVLKTMSA
jgi:multiple sugar transport system substrate-binding protein